MSLHLGTRSRFFSSSISRYIASPSKDMVALRTISAPRINVADDDIVFDPKNTPMETFLYLKNDPSLYGLGVVGESRRKFMKSRRKFGKSRRSPTPCFFVFFVFFSVFHCFFFILTNKKQTTAVCRETDSYQAFKPFFLHVGIILLWKPAAKLVLQGKTSLNSLVTTKYLDCWT